MARLTLRTPVRQIIACAAWAGLLAWRALAGTHRAIMRVETWHLFAVCAVLSVVTIPETGWQLAVAWGCATVVARRLLRAERRAAEAEKTAIAWQVSAQGYASKVRQLEDRAAWADPRPGGFAPPGDGSWR
jgi:hypothetical protein